MDKPKVIFDKPKKMKQMPKDFYNMKDSIEKEKKIRHSDVFGKQGNKSKEVAKKTKKKVVKKKY